MLSMLSMLSYLCYYIYLSYSCTDKGLVGVQHDRNAPLYDDGHSPCIVRLEGGRGGSPGEGGTMEGGREEVKVGAGVGAGDWEGGWGGRAFWVHLVPCR